MSYSADSWAQASPRMLFVRALCRRRLRLAESHPLSDFLRANHGAYAFARSLEQASDSYMVAATNPRFEGVGGKFIVDGQENAQAMSLTTNKKRDACGK